MYGVEVYCDIAVIAFSSVTEGFIAASKSCFCCLWIAEYIIYSACISSCPGWKVIFASQVVHEINEAEIGAEFSHSGVCCCKRFIEVSDEDKSVVLLEDILDMGA